MDHKLVIENVRIVHGNPGQARDKINMRTGAKVLNDKGEQVKEWVCGVAIPKAYFNSHVWPVLSAAATPMHPQGIPGDFSWKVKDGDGMDAEGKPYSAREGYAGCFVLTIKTEAYPPSLWKWENGSYVRLDPNEMKCGYTVNAAVIIKHNGQTAGNGAGVYVNPDGFVLTQYTPEISTGANPNDIFAGVAPSAPVGHPGPGSAPSNGMPSGNGGGFPNNGQPAANTTVQQQPPVNTTANTPPANNFVNNAMGNGQPANNPGGFPNNNGGQSANNPGSFPGQPGPR